MSRKYYQGRFIPQHREKYLGNPDAIIYRSSWEKKVCAWLDTSADIVEWSSEEIIIPYISPVDGKPHRYFPDFFARVKQPDGTVKSMVIEVKPRSQIEAPKLKKRITKNYITEVTTYGVNQAKWAAAKEYCLDRGWEFRTLDEYEMGLK